MSDVFETSKDVTWLKELYFADPKNRIILQPGDVLIREGNFNDKLFLIIDGTLSGYLQDEKGVDFEVFKSSRNMFVGVYSFFSSDHRSYLTLIADETSTVAFIEQELKNKSEEKFAAHFLPVIVHEIYLRQLLTQKFTQQKHAAFEKLYENEKMATLGQLAAGLAHELNNAVGVLQRNTEWLIHAFSEYLKGKKLNSIFEIALQEGLTYNSVYIRERRKTIEKTFGIPGKLAKQLAKTNLTDDQIKHFIQGDLRILEAINLITETGFVLHDMKVAATHSTHVVHSVRDLGFSNSDVQTQTSLYQTIRQALALAKSMMQNIHVEITKNSEGDLVLNPGDLVQIWLNLIKNACESMNTANIENAELTIEIKEQEDNYHVVIGDNGPGIKPSLLQKIFEPNFSTKVKGLSFGLGLGLSIVKRIVANLNGIIMVSSKPGETFFTIQIPKKNTSE